MTNLEAIRSYIEPYEVTDGKLKLYLEEVGLQPNLAYNAQTQKPIMIPAIVAALRSLLPLKGEKDNGSSLTYDINGLLALIKWWEDQAEIKNKPQNRDMTAYW